MIAGHLRIRNGIYQVILNYYDANGKRQTRSVSTKLKSDAKNKKQAEEMLMTLRINFSPTKWNERLTLIENAVPTINPSTGEINTLFSDFILDWLEIIKYNISLSTYAGYSSAIKKRIVPYFKKMGYTLRDLENNPKYIQDYYQYELTKLHSSTSTVIRRHANIRSCLQYAFQIGLIQSNPADRIKRPRKNAFSCKYYTAAELVVLFQCIEHDPLKLPILIASFYGLRRSEIIGLKWDCIDFKRKTIAINHTVTNTYLDGKCQTISQNSTKTRSSLRTLPLVKPIELLLINLKKQQRKQMKLLSTSYCRDYLEYVFRKDNGERLNPGFVSQHFSLLLKKNNLKSIRFHDLRHSCASLLYANGVDMKAIQEWLGHSTISTTANIYAHFDFSKKTESANAIIEILSGIR